MTRAPLYPGPAGPLVWWDVLIGSGFEPGPEPVDGVGDGYGYGDGAGYGYGYGDGVGPE